MKQTQTFKVTVETCQPEQSQAGIMMVEEKAIGALCYLPKSIHMLATHESKNRDTTAKRFYFEALLIGLEQQGVITREQHAEALRLPNEYGWKGRKQ